MTIASSQIKSPSIQLDGLFILLKRNMLVTIMGRGAESVLAVEDKAGIVSIVYYADGRRAVVECNKGIYIYGGRCLNNESVSSFRVNFANDAELCGNLISVIRDFFLDGIIPVPLEESLEIQAIMQVTEDSIVTRRVEPVKWKT